MMLFSIRMFWKYISLPALPFETSSLPRKIDWVQGPVPLFRMLPRMVMSVDGRSVFWVPDWIMSRWMTSLGLAR